MATNQVSAQARGIVVVLEGKAWVVNADGVRKPLQVGDEVQEGQQVITEDGTRLELGLPNGQPLTIASGREVLIEGNLLGIESTNQTEAALNDLNSGAAQIAKVLAGSGDLSAELDATEAGLRGGEAGGSHGFVRVLRISEELTALELNRDVDGFVVDQLDLGRTNTVNSVDLSAPSVLVNIVDASLNVADASSSVTFTFSQAPVGFTLADITATNGSVSALSATADPLVYSATFTAAPGYEGSGAVNVTAGSYTDAAGNPGTGNGDTVAIDTAPPVAVADARTVTEDDNSIIGNVITGVGASADTLGADTVSITGAQVGNAGTSEITSGVSTALVGAYGTLTLQGNGAYTYVTNAAAQALNVGNSQDDVFSYTLKDSDGVFSTTTVTMTVTGANDVPVITNLATARTGTVIEAGHLDDGTAVSGAASATGTLTATDVDTSATQTWSLQGTPSTTYGTMALNASTGVWTYTLNNTLAATQALKEGQIATQSYTARVTDDFGAQVEQTITVTITGTNDVPVAIGSSASGFEDAVSIPVVLQGTDIDGTVASFSLTSLPANGALYLDAALTILAATGTDIAATGNSLTLYFKPSADFNSGSLSGSITPSFNFTAKDSSGAVSNVATDTITVTAVSDGAPIAVNDGFKALVGTPITFTRAQLLGNDSLLDHAAISSIGPLPTGLTYNSVTQTYTYAPLTAGSGSFTYTITDDDGQTSTATVSLNAYSSTTDLATVHESALPSGTGTGVSAITGNLFTNDAGLSGNITSISGGTSTLSGNIYTVTTTYGTLVVDRTSGAYTYTLNAAVDNDSATGATPADLVQTFTYARTGGSANFLVSIVDDIPTAQNNIVEIPQAGAQINYNLVLMLDISGSMIDANAGGAVRLVDANGNVTIGTRLDASKQAMIDMVTKYFNESASVSVKVGYFSTTATAGTASLTTLSSVIAAINAIPATGGSTNYEDALYKIQDMYGVVDTSKTNITYFISDGVPTVQVGTGNGIAAPATETNGTANPVSYTQFLANNPSVLSYSVGIGGGISNTAPLDSIHNVDADGSNVKDPAILVNDLNQLSSALTSTIPRAFGGNIGAGGSPFVKIGADGGFVQHIDLLLDSNDAGTVPDSIVRFTFNGSNQITYDNFYLTGTHTTVTINSSQLTLNSALGFTKGLLVFNFASGDYSYYAQGAATSGDQFDIGFTVTDNDGDTASATETIKIINGKPIAYDDRDTLLPKNTFFDGNVITGSSTDGANQSVTVFGAGAGADMMLDNAKITSIAFNGATFNLTAVSSGTLGGGAYTVNAAKELTWTSSSDPTNTLVFHADGYYKYTPPTSQTSPPTQGSLTTVSFNSAALVSAGGLTLQGVTRTGSVNAPDGTLDYSTTGIGITGGSSSSRVDNLETLIIKFNAATYAQGVQNVSLNINSGSSNLGTGTAIAVSVYDILGNLLGQVAITSEGVVALPSNWSNIGKILIEPNSNAQVLIDDIRFNPVNLNTTAAAIPDTVISYTLTDDQGDTASANLTLHIVTNEIQGTTANDTITGTAGNDAVEGFAGNDTLYGGAGNDVVKGGAGDDAVFGEDGGDQLYGGAGNDTIRGGSGNDLISGDVGDDQLFGDGGNDTIRGGAGNDTIDGGSGDDIVLGGAGDDILTGGGLGSDTFKWELADVGAKGAPARDTIMDFDAAPVASGGDALDLRDLLNSENHAVDTGNLASYLHFEKSGANTVIHVSSIGEFSAGFDSSKEVQTITLNGVDLVGSFSNDQQIIQSLLNNNKLITD